MNPPPPGVPKVVVLRTLTFDVVSVPSQLVQQRICWIMLHPTHPNVSFYHDHAHSMPLGGELHL